MRNWCIGVLRHNGSKLTSVLLIFTCSLAVATFGQQPGEATKAANNKEKRLFTINDLVNSEGTTFAGLPAFSPDGSQLTFVRTDQHVGSFRSNVLVAKVDSTAAPVAITDAAKTGFNYMQPKWSPDGRHLIFAARRGQEVQLELWDRVSNHMTALGRPIMECPSYDSMYSSIFEWVNKQQVLMMTAPICADSPDPRISPAAQPALQGWIAQKHGGHPSSSALDSLPGTERKPLHHDLVLLDIVSGKTRLVARGDFSGGDTPGGNLPGVGGCLLSPNGKAVVCRQRIGFYKPIPGNPIATGVGSIGKDTFGLLIAKLDENKTPIEVAEQENVLEESIRWSPDGSKLAYITRDPDDTKLSTLRVYDLATKRSKPVFTGIAPATTQNFLHFNWNGASSLTGLAVPEVNSAQAAGSYSASVKYPIEPYLDLSKTYQWFVWSESKGSRIIPYRPPTAPERLYRETNGSVVWLSKGKLWRLAPDQESPEELNNGFTIPIKRITWPIPRYRSSISDTNRLDQCSHLVVETGEDTSRAYYLVDLQKNSFHLLRAGTGTARLNAFSLNSGWGAFFDTAGDRSVFSIDHTASGARRELLATNKSVSEFKPIKVRSFVYRGAGGTDLVGMLWLPPEYDPGKRYPLIVEQYLGDVFPAGTLPKDIEISPPGGSMPSAALVSIMTAHGYAVMKPSLPTPAPPYIGDPMDEILPNLMPAVDKVIEMGVADPERLGVWGHSFGGYGVYSIVSQTNRFKAAVASAGPSDLASVWGTFIGPVRYHDSAADSMYAARWTEVDQGAMGGPPWQDPERYVRNSPIFRADKIQTPLLIVHGDLDEAVPIEQSEEMFSALKRLGKRARFIRYWGEGHVYHSPANLRDEWTQILAWFDEFLKPEKTESGKP